MMSLTCMGLKNGLFIYMLRQYFKSVPESLEEAAYVDGCSTLHTFVKIMLPDAVPTIASCFLFSFVWQWTDLFYTRNFLTGYTVYSRELSAMVSKMGKYFSQSATETVTVPLGRQMQLIGIGVFVCCVPLIILYCFTQKTFVQSLVMTGSKE
jgi:multiple sugar transport system permease protein